MSEEINDLSLLYQNGQTVMEVQKQVILTKSAALKLADRIKQWANSLSDKKPRAPRVRTKPVAKRAPRPSRKRIVDAAETEASTPA